MSGRGVLRIIEDDQLGFWCPGCENMHVLDGSWNFNGDYNKPTFSPSILVTSGHCALNWNREKCWCTFNKEHPEQIKPFHCERCHSFVRDGDIQFLSDCSHSMVGQTVPLVAVS